MTAATPRLAELAVQLGRAQRRSRGLLLLRGAVWSIVAALSILCLLQVLPLLGSLTGPVPDGSARPLPDLAQLLPAAAAVLLIALVLVLTHAALAVPSNLELARRADAVFGFEERLSTALEVAGSDVPGRPSSPGVIERSLMLDAERKGASLQPERLVPLSLPRSAWGVPVLLAIVTLMQVAPPTFLVEWRGGGAGTAESGASALGETERSQLAADIKRIAQLLEKDSEERADPYLAAVARTLDRLGEDVQSGSGNRQQLAAELERLLGHTRDAYSRAGSEMTERQNDMARLLEAALLQADPGRLPPETDLAGNRNGEAEPLRTDDAENGADADALASGDDRPGDRPDLAELLNDMERSDEQAPSAAISGEASTVVQGDYDMVQVDPRVEREREFMEQQRLQQMAGGTPIGAAQNAGKGESSQAGKGTQPLEGEGDPESSPAFERAEQVLLPDQEDRQGQRIRIDLPTDAALANVSDVVTAGRGQWARGREETVSRQALGVAEREAVMRYFAQADEDR